MGLKAPKITVDPSALKQGIWGNTWKEWGWILLAFTILYAFLGGYLTGMLYAALGIRTDAYRTMSGKYFGPFDRALLNASIETLPSTGGVKDPDYFNRPDGCVALEESVPLSADFPGINITQPTGILACSNSNKQWRWTVYPWVLETNGLGNYPGCANAAGAASTAYTYLSNESPAGGDAAPSTPAARAALVCQNNLPATAL
ncbi:expressed protein [Chlorella variabilis]|uniref:Expressed protein n=1 Tax=Chlorella variabilis TaxID=554065 RepID=E1ZB70_CHLVA|nr:expressed protein [Chlorella variabilis]EFN56973.1 expressed protein [Chlorella variabilis]|eukprot:XP_005849075.1 expressed protein [Chlorella variabilis]